MGMRLELSVVLCWLERQMAGHYKGDKRVNSIPE